MLPPQGFALAMPFPWNSLCSNITLLFPTFFKDLLPRVILSEAFLGHFMQDAAPPPTDAVSLLYVPLLRGAYSTYPLLTLYLLTVFFVSVRIFISFALSGTWNTAWHTVTLGRMASG